MGIEALSRGAKSAVFVDMPGGCLQKVVRENLAKHGWKDARKSCPFRLPFVSAFCRETFDLIFLDPPYAEVFLENSLKTISEIDILSDSGIIITERPFGKELPASVQGLSAAETTDMEKAAVTIYRRPTPGGSYEKSHIPRQL